MPDLKPVSDETKAALEKELQAWADLIALDDDPVDTLDKPSMTAEQERERIVAWLEKQASSLRRVGAWGDLAPVCADAAQAIQRGEHWEGVE